jgi:hypothetical protein
VSAERILAALKAVRSVDAGAIAAAYPDTSDLPQRIRAARLEALRIWEQASDAAT